MKKAALYARVSSDLQKKEKTIDSQILELRKQIEKHGNTLVKEYIDDGYSGARLDRPAMDELRKDLKTGVFEVIYFLNTDRIARDVTYQNIIVAEILKKNKQLIINGKDYVHNPENKFTLTVLGAVSELERAKITERVIRGKALKLSQGHNPGRGSFLYGYDFHHKTKDIPSAYFTVNEKQADVVKLLFTEYSKGIVSTHELATLLMSKGYATRFGKSKWHSSVIEGMLRNYSYTGTMYFNKMKLIREYADPTSGITKTRKYFVKRDKSKWVGIAVPSIVSQELFDQVQERLDWNKKHKRVQGLPSQLLSNLITCGMCGSSYTSSKSVYRRATKDNPNNKAWRMVYICNGNRKETKCRTSQLQSHIVESKVWNVVETLLTNSEALKEKIPVIQGKTANAKLRLKRQLQKAGKEITKLEAKRKRIIDLFTNGDVLYSDYIEKIAECDEELQVYDHTKKVLESQLPTLHKESVINEGIESFCKQVKKDYSATNSFESKRNFCLKYIEKIVHDENNYLTIYGSVPLESTARLEFKIKKIITEADRKRKSI